MFMYHVLLLIRISPICIQSADDELAGIFVTPNTLPEYPPISPRKKKVDGASKLRTDASPIESKLARNSPEGTMPQYPPLTPSRRGQIGQNAVPIKSSQQSDSKKIEKMPETVTGAVELDLRERKDLTGIFPKRISWKTKIATLQLAKTDAWHNGATRFSKRLFKWEREVGLRAPAHAQDEKKASQKLDLVPLPPGGKLNENAVHRKERTVTKKRPRR